MQRRQFYRVVSVSLIVCICAVFFSGFITVPVLEQEEKSGLNAVVVSAAEAVAVEVASELLLEILASLGVTAAAGSVYSTFDQEKRHVEQYEQYVAETTNSVNFVLDGVTYQIMHPDCVVNLTDSFAQQIQEAINNSHEAKEEFENLIQAVLNGAEITGGMLKNLWLMLAKGAVDDYNVSTEQFVNHAGTWLDEYDIYCYTNWSPRMQELYRQGYTNYVFYTVNDAYTIALYPDNVNFVSYTESSGNVCTGFNSSDYYVFTFISPLSNVYSRYFPLDIMSGWDSVLGSFDLEYFKTRYISFTSSIPCWAIIADSRPHYDYEVQFVSDALTDIAFEFPTDGTVDIPLPGDTTEDKPYILNPSDVITQIPEKIANDEVITIPDDTSLEDVVAIPPGALVGDTSTGIALPWEILGELVPVDDEEEIVFPWEVAPDLPVPIDPDLPVVVDPAVPIPGIEFPEIDVNDYRIDSLAEKFPFCIPFDVINCVSLLAASPEAPKFEYRFYIKSLNIDETFVIDLKDFEPVAELSRWFFRILFILGLALITRNKMIRG